MRRRGILCKEPLDGIPGPALADEALDLASDEGRRQRTADCRSEI